MLIARVYQPVLFLVDGGKIVGARGVEILHDESGADWPADEALMMSFARTGKPVKRVTKAQRDHFGPDYAPKLGKVDLPPRSLKSWSEVGPVAKYEGLRRGKHHNPNGHEHFYAQRGIFSFVRKEPPMLYKRGAIYRLTGVEWDWTGSRG